MNGKQQQLQDTFLNQLRKDKTSVSVFLVNGIKLQGKIESFDQYVVFLENGSKQMIFKHAISTVVPGSSQGGNHGHVASGHGPA